MKYMGSKRRIAKYILPYILQGRSKNQWYIEPFVGGANIIDKVKGKRLGSDINNYLIEALKAIQDGWLPPMKITEEEYYDIKKNKDNYPDYFVGYVGFTMSFGAKWFDGYAKGDNRDYAKQAFKSTKKQVTKLKDIIFKTCEYNELKIPPNSIIYCDPPYKGTKEYKNKKFNHDKFWEWCRKKVKEGHKVFISEYNAPPDFICIWEKKVKITTSLDNYKTSIEKLFQHKSQVIKREKQSLLF